MKNLKKLGIAVCLLLVFAIPAFADCPFDPGIQSTPPCSVAQGAPDDSVDDSVASNQATAATQSVTDTNVSISEVALEMVVNLLTVF